MQATVDDWRWLVEGEGRAWATDPPEGPLHEVLSRLRRQMSATRAALVVELQEVRRKGRARFAQIDQMFFTRRALEQATDPTIAAYKAQRFSSESGILDLACGCGGDLLELSRRGVCLGIDSDPILAYLADRNLESLHLTNGDVRCGRIEDHIEETSGRQVHVDPDRRLHGTRTTQLIHHSPGPALLEEILARCAGMALKLAPATDTSTPLLGGAELEWIGHRGECQQLVAWFGDLAQSPGQKRATWYRGDAFHSATGPGVSPPFGGAQFNGELGTVVYEPYASVLAAGLAPYFAERDGLKRLTPGGGYLTGDGDASIDWAERFEVLEVIPFRLDRIAQVLQRLDCQFVEVKKRRVTIDPAQVLRALRGPGGRQATLILFSRGAKIVAAVTHRAAGQDRASVSNDLPADDRGETSYD